MEMWETAITPMEKPRLSLPANAVSHNFIPLAVYAHSHSTYYERTTYSCVVVI